jgi:hypothetical protein
MFAAGSGGCACRDLGSRGDTRAGDVQAQAGRNFASSSLAAFRLPRERETKLPIPSFVVCRIRRFRRHVVPTAGSAPGYACHCQTA